VCAQAKRIKSQSFDHHHIKKQIESVNGYKLLSTEYINAHKKLDIMCNNGHSYTVTWNDFQQGNRCPVCYEQNRNKSQRLDYEYVKEQIESINGYKLLSTEYKNNCTGILVKCPKGHEWHVTYSAFRGGTRCPVCNGGVKLTYNHVKNQIEKEGYKLLSTEYINAQTKIKLKCDKGHEYSVIYNSFQRGCRCPICDNAKTSSKAEIEIQDYIKTLTDNVICNDRTQIYNHTTKRPLELDVWMPDLNKAIEYNGTYWHSLDKQQIKDAMKQQQCDLIGIKLLTIDEESYTINKDKVLKDIKKFIDM